MKEIAIISEKGNEHFTMSDLEEAMELLKPGKAAGLDGITTEMIQHFGAKSVSWILDLYNNCANTMTIPKA